MSGRPAARAGDPTTHGSPLQPGPPASTVLWNGLPAWKGIPLDAGAELQATQKASEDGLKALEQTAQAAEKASLAAAGTPGAPAAAAAATTARTAAETAKGAAATKMITKISALAASGASLHMCPVPWPVPVHGAGVIIDGSKNVLVENLPATREGDTCIEPIGPPDKIAKGTPEVLIGNNNSSGKFPTAEAAAIDAMKTYNKQSVDQNREFGGWVYKNPDGTYSYEPATPGTVNSVSFPDKEENDRVWWHTHGGPDPRYKAEEFSFEDKEYSASNDAPGYVATPSGSMKKYWQRKGTVTTLPGTAPH